MVMQKLHSVSKNVPTLESCSFNKHKLILIIFGNKHQHTFKNDTDIQLSWSLHFYLLYLLLNSSDGNDAFWRHSMLMKQSRSPTRRVEYAYHFWKCADVFYKKIIKISPCLTKLQLAIFSTFLRHSVCS